MSNIRFLKRKEIDDKKWNELIQNSFNSLPYALAWYLDAVAENWGALVLNDYEAAMPLVWLRKLGIKCLYQPYYCQQLGVFSIGTITQQIYFDFLDAASDKYLYININLNNAAFIVANELFLPPRLNLLLPLGKDYAGIQKNYSENHKRNITKARKAKLQFFENTDLNSFQQFYLGNVNRNKENFKLKHEKVFKNLSQFIIKNKHGHIYTACNEKGELLAAVLIVKHKKRLVGIINTSSATGKKCGASHFIFDKIIQQYANSDLVLDFEGSSIPTVARFYESFGAKHETFFNYKRTILKNPRRRV